MQVSEEFHKLSKPRMIVVNFAGLENQRSMRKYTHARQTEGENTCVPRNKAIFSRRPGIFPVKVGAHNHERQSVNTTFGKTNYQFEKWHILFTKL